MDIQPELHITSETTFHPAIRSWEIFLLDQGRSLHTVKAFLGDMRLFANYFPSGTTIGSISTDDIYHFLGWLQHERHVPCSPKSLSRRITSIKSFFRWLSRSGRIPSDPAEKVLQKTVISPLPDVLTPEEEVLALEAARALRVASKPDPRPYVLLSLLLSTGIKKGECLALTLNHIDPDSPKSPRLFVRYSASGSRYKERNIQLNEDWSRLTRSIWMCTIPSNRFSPGLRAALSTCLKISPSTLDYPNTFHSLCAAGPAP